ncbi:MAG: DUF262 domain-containing protein [Synergistaceae bacterium]|nr:DUF262 domain-containing protein [Synergistaceae bacterium]
MMGFQAPITIKTAIDNIQSNTYLLPAIQRKFVWSSEQIEMLFDSILRDYPINSFMFWRVSDKNIKSGYKFYSFLTSYREFFHDDNEYINTAGAPDFYTVIDGQQRLTSLYIGMRGTYAYKLPRKWWKDDEESIPTRKLYLKLSGPVPPQYDSQKYYDFRFLTKNEVKPDCFEVGEILNFGGISDVLSTLNKMGLSGNQYAVDTLSKLYEVVHLRPTINYYLQTEQDSDKVLEIFIRTNSGGTPLSFSDLLMSISSANWKTIDARKEFDQLISEVYSIGKPGFIIDKDFILKTCLVLFVGDIKFKLANFTAANVSMFENNWQNVRKAIVSVFSLLDALGYNNVTFRAKNAAIPLIYHAYNSKLTDGKAKNYSQQEKQDISRWLALTFIKSIFSGHTDSVLTAMRNVLNGSTSQSFPVQALMNAFKNDPNKNYSCDDSFIDGLLEAQKDSNEAFYVLHLLYFSINCSGSVHQDHLHPSSVFKNDKKMQQCIPQADWNFASKPENWNSVANLQLLPGPVNSSKNASPLEDWAAQNNISSSELFVPAGTSLKIADFRSFITARRKVLKDRIKNLLPY